MGDNVIDYLVSAAASATTEDCANIVSATQHSREHSLESIGHCINSLEEEEQNDNDIKDVTI